MVKKMTLENLGTPLGRIYRGSGRLTGDVVSEDIPVNAFDRESNYTWVGDLTEEKFEAQFLHEEHVECHNSRYFKLDCPECVAAGWTFKP